MMTHPTLRIGRILAPLIVFLTGCAGPSAELDSVKSTEEELVTLLPFTTIKDEALTESSGLVHHDDAFWSHNDGGNEAVLFRCEDLSFGTAERLTVPGVQNVDWEEITVYQGDLLICDFGDNRRIRDHVTIYRVRVLKEDTGRRLELVATYPYRYPDGSRDAEACFVRDDVIHVVSKAWGDGTALFVLRDPRDKNELGPGEFNVIEWVDSLQAEEDEQVTGAAFHQESQTLLLLTFAAILRFPGDHLSGSPETITRILARQCEAIAFWGDHVVITNEERDVFLLENFLDRRITALLPPQGTTFLPRTTTPLRTETEWAERSQEIPLKNTRPGESFRWARSPDQLLFQGRVTADSFRFTGIDSAEIGSAFYFMVGRDRERRITGSERQFAVTASAEDSLSLWRLDIVRGSFPRVELETGISGSVRDGWFTFEGAVDLDEIFGEAVPDRFLFDARGNGLRLDENDVHFSAPGFYSSERPYAWGTVETR